MSKDDKCVEKLKKDINVDEYKKILKKEYDKRNKFMFLFILSLILPIIVSGGMILSIGGSFLNFLFSAGCGYLIIAEIILTYYENLSKIKADIKRIEQNLKNCETLKSDILDKKFNDEKEKTENKKNLYSYNTIDSKDKTVKLEYNFKVSNSKVKKRKK